MWSFHKCAAILTMKRKVITFVSITYTGMLTDRSVYEDILITNRRLYTKLFILARTPSLHDLVVGGTLNPSSLTHTSRRFDLI